ncbi:MAG: dockerin type I domain-containing protein [Thermofilum sp.]|nr:dockerin type I domain-containing protein [Thermofilum sp.]
MKRPFSLGLILLLLTSATLSFLPIPVVKAEEKKVWTDKTVYYIGEYISIHVNLAAPMARAKAAFSAELPAHPLAQAQEELKLLWMKYGRDGVPYATCNIGSAVYVVGYSGWARAVIEARDMNTGELLNSWEHTYGNITALYDCAVLDGYLYAIGVDNAPGDEEWLILKFTSDLKLVGERHYNPSDMNDEAWIIVTDRENLYIGGYYSSNEGKDSRWHLIKVNPSDLSILKSYVSNPSDGWDELHSVSINLVDGKIWAVGSVNALSLSEGHGRIEVLDKNLSLSATKDVQYPLLCVVFDEVGFAYIPAPPQWLLKVSPDLQQINTMPFSHIPYKMVYSEGHFYLAITSRAGFFKNALVRTTKNLDNESTLSLSPEDYEDYFFEPIGKMIIVNNKLFVAGYAVKGGEKKWVVYSVAQTSAPALNVDVWTNEGGKGTGGLGGGIFSIGENASFYCSIDGDAGYLKVWMESPDGNIVTLFENFGVRAGTYEFKRIIGGPEGEWRLKAVACPAGQSCLSGDMLSKDETSFQVTKAGELKCATLITVKPDTPTIDDYVEFTLSVSCQEGSEVGEIDLYVDGSLARRWQGEGNLRISSKYSAGTHTYHLVIVGRNGQESRVPERGEYSFNVLIAEGVAGPPTLWITPFEVVVSYNGETYRAFYAVNISAPDNPPDPNKDRNAHYTWRFSKFNWYVLDSGNQVVEDEDVYVKIATAAQIAFNTLAADPGYLRERARFFRDARLLGTIATLLKKFGEMLAGCIPKVALGAALPSSAGVERFGVIAEFAKGVKERAKETADVDYYITSIAFLYLTDAENSLLRASELAEPVYNELMANPSRPKAHVEYSSMLELYELTKRECKGFAGISMLSQLNKEGMRGYLEGVIKGIIEGADPTGLSAVASNIQKVPEVREFFDQMGACESEQHIRDAAFERGARSFARVARRYAETVKRGDVGGVVAVRNGKFTSFNTVAGVEIKGEIQGRKIVLNVDSSVPRGKTIIVDLDKGSLPIARVEDVSVTFDGEKIGMADNLADVLNPNDDEKPEFLVLWGSKGAQVLISIPRFSAHIIEIICAPGVRGDVNGDGIIDYKDLAVIVARYGSRQGDSSYLGAADVNGDGVIDYRDLALVAAHYGESR